MSLNNSKKGISRIFGATGSMEGKLFCIAAFGLLVTELLNLISNIFLNVKADLFITAGVMLAMTLLVSLITIKTEGYSVGYTVMCILINVILLPCAFVFCGGFHSGISVYMIMGFVVSGCHPNRKAGLLCAGLAAAMYALLFALVWWRPDIVQALPEEAIIPDICRAVLLGTVMVVLLTTFYLNSYQSMYARNLKDYEQKTEMRMALLESQVENIEDVKRQRHNMRHHNRIIGEFAEKHDLKGLRKYLREKQYSDEFYSKRLYCMNVEINNILTIYDRLAMNKGVTMTVNADVKSELQMEESELINMISTVLENAINGAVTSNQKEKKIDLEIRERGRRLVLNCKNTCAPNLKEMSEYPGFPGNGIEAVELTLNSVGGILDYSIEKGNVICRLIVDAF